MTRPDVPSGKMERVLHRIACTDRLRLDASTANRILDGVVSSDDAPPGYRRVAKALDALRAAPTVGELDGESSSVASVVARLDGATALGTALRRTPARSARRFAQIAAASLVGSASLFTGLAAANALPGTAQGVASEVLGHLGVSVPDPSSHAGPHPDARHSSGDHAQPPTTSTPGTGKGADISQLAHTTPSTGVDKGAAISTEASDGHSQAGEHGGSNATAHPTGGPPVSTPNVGGTTTANNASGGKSAAGTSTADAHSDGHSGAGSANSNGAAGHKP